MPFARSDSHRNFATGFRWENGGYGFAPWGWGFPYGDFGGGYWDNGSEAPQAPQVIVVALQPQPPPPPPAPPEPPRAVTHDYTWPAPANDGAAFYTLVSKDGNVRFAIAVWVSDGLVYYTGRDRSSGSIPLAAIDRDATQRLNAENRVTLALPGVTPSQ